MSNVVWMLSVSLDGFMEDPNHGLEWQTIDDELHRHFNAWLATAAVFIEGRVTYELMAGFWPTADADPDQPAVMREFAPIWRDKRKYVYSSTLPDAEWNTIVLRSIEPAFVRGLAAESDGDIVIGGADLGGAFMDLDLIDEYRLYVHPIVLGAGKRMFVPRGAAVPLRLAETQTFGSGVVMLRYSRGS